MAMPLRLSVVVDPPGAYTPVYRWGVDEPKPENTFSGLAFSTTMPGGFEQMSCKLTRKPIYDYPDLTEFSTVKVFGVGGEPAWEGRLQASPRTSGAQISIDPSAVGWQAALDDDNSARMIYIDIDLSKWQGSTAARKLAVSTYDPNNFNLTDAGVNSSPVIECGLQAPWVSPYTLSVCEVFYDAKGLPIDKFYYAAKNGTGGTTGGWAWQPLVCIDDLISGGGYDTGGNVVSASPIASFLQATTSTRIWAVWQLYFSGVSGAADTTWYNMFLTHAGITGKHGLTMRGTWAADPTTAFGVYASDVINHAVITWAHQLATSRAGVSTIEPTLFIIPQLAFLDPTTAGNIINAALLYHTQMDWWVDEGPTFNLASWNKHGRQWRARVGPSGLQETGPDVTQLCNKVIVTYNDVTGTARTVGPTGSGANTIDDTLADADPSNPVTLAGLVRYPPTPLPNIGVSTAAAAAAVGRRFLSEQNQKSTAGSATLVGYVEDNYGILWPSWMVRSGDWITFVDAHDPVPRRIVKTNYNDDTRANGISLDSPPEDLDAVLARMQSSVFGLT